MKNRKYTVVILFFTLINLCYGSKIIEKSEHIVIQIDTINKEDNAENFREIGLDEKIGNRTLRDYLLDEKIPQIFKDIFHQSKHFSYYYNGFQYDEEDLFPILDSLLSTDEERHPFYFVLATRAMWWADGGFAEVFVMAIKKYVESNPQQFLIYFLTERVLTSFNFEQWAKCTLYEIFMDSGDDLKKGIENTSSLMKINCKGCSSEQMEMIDKFIETMYAVYEELEKENANYELENYH